MNPKKIYFEEPVVRIPLDKVRFPRLCPICGKEGTQPARIIATPGKYRFLRPEWDPSFHPSVRRTQGLKPPEMKSLLLYVCDEHYKSDEDDTNFRVLCIIGNGLLGGAFIFAAFGIGNSLWSGRDVGIIPYLAVLAFFISLVITIISFRAGPLAAAVKIVGFDGGLQNIWLQLKRSDYRDVFVEENAMYAELVSWITRS